MSDYRHRAVVEENYIQRGARGCHLRLSPSRHYLHALLLASQIRAFLFGFYPIGFPFLALRSTLYFRTQCFSFWPTLGPYSAWSHREKFDAEFLCDMVIFFGKAVAFALLEFRSYAARFSIFAIQFSSDTSLDLCVLGTIP